MSVTITTEEFNSFVDYCLMFYGEGEMFANRGFATRSDVTEATNIYLTRGDDKFFCDIGEGPEHRWGGGDTVDREIVAEILIEEFGVDLY